MNLIKDGKGDFSGGDGEKVEKKLKIGAFQKFLDIIQGAGKLGEFALSTKLP